MPIITDANVLIDYCQSDLSILGLYSARIETILVSSEIFEEVAQQPLPVARALGETSLMFLCHLTLTEAEIDKRCRVLGEVTSQAAERRKTHYRLLGKQTGVHPPQTGYRGIPATSDEEQD